MNLRIYMNFIRKPAWVLFAFLALSNQMGHAMEKKRNLGDIVELDTVSQKIGKNCMMEVLKLACIDRIKDRHPLTNLKLVCKKWNQIIQLLIKKERPIDSPFYKPFYGISGDNEAIFERFLKGSLIYKKDTNEQVELPIAKLTNPLEGTFDLSRCGDTGKYMSIHTGYRKGKKQENANKVEIWFTPRFLVEKEINTTAGHFKEIFPAKWSTKAPIGIFWTWGEWDNLGWYDYLTEESIESLSDVDLWENYTNAKMEGARRRGIYNRLAGLRGGLFHVS